MNDKEFEEAYKQYHGLVFKACRVAARDYPLCVAEEWAQEAWLHLYREWDRFIMPDDLTPEEQKKAKASWVYTVAHNKAVNCYRRERRHERDAAIASTNSVPEDFTEAIEAKKDVDSILGRLSPKLEEATRLQHIHGMSHKEIAEHLQVSKESIKKRLQRANEIIDYRRSE